MSRHKRSKSEKWKPSTDKLTLAYGLPYERKVAPGKALRFSYSNAD
jgi:hypothetical protein